MLHSTGQELGLDTPLVAAEIDSLASVELVQSMRAEFGENVTISEQMIFTGLTLRELGDQIDQKLGGNKAHTMQHSTIEAPVSAVKAPVTVPISIGGMACVLAGDIYNVTVGDEYLSTGY